MKKSLLYLFSFLVAFELNAFDFIDSSSNLKEFDKIMKQFKLNKDEVQAHRYKLEREEILKNDNACSHCPKYLLLTEQINKVVDKMGHDPKITEPDGELPVKINQLKFLFFTETINTKDGKKECKRFLDNQNLDFTPTKFDGQFVLMAEDALRFSDVTSIQYMNHDLDEVVYYYRGKGADKDVVVQAIMTKGGGKFRYYRYIPSQKELNPYNLPDLDKRYDEASLSFEKDKAVEEKSFLGTGIKVPEGQMGNDKFNIKLKADVEKQGKYIPKNVHLMEAKVEQEIYQGIKIKGTSEASLRGNNAKVVVKNGEGNDLVAVDLNTKLNGETTHRIVVPYSIRTLENSTTEVKGKLQVENGAQIVTMSIADRSLEYIRSEYRKNTVNNTDSYVIARDFRVNPNEVVSVSVAKGEDDKKFASLRHAKVLKNNISLVLDVRVNEDKQASIYYNVSAKF